MIGALLRCQTRFGSTLDSAGDARGSNCGSWTGVAYHVYLDVDGAAGRIGRDSRIERPEPVPAVEASCTHWPCQLRHIFDAYALLQRGKVVIILDWFEPSVASFSCHVSRDGCGSHY